MRKIEIFINKKRYRVDGNKTILEVCKENNIDIPALCYHSDLEVNGSCRMCLVKIEGIKD